MVKRSNKLKALTILLFSMVLLTLIMPNNINSNIENDKTQYDAKTENIETSAVITEEIRINASDPARNWLWASGEPWCSGSGMAWDPYVIENLVIDCQNSHSGIVIQESQNTMLNEFFIIRNNIIYNIGDTDSDSAGIKIYKSRDGEIRNNTISSSRDGNYGIHLVGDGFMMMKPTREINITENYITNTERGIYLEESCSDILVSENIAKLNSLSGIYLAKGNRRINITNNILDENDVFGIADTGSGMMGMSTYANNIINNSICNNVYGFYLAQTFYCNIRLNNISYNDINGIYISGSQDSTIRDNIISDNTEKGILMVMGPIGSLRNKIYRNNFLRNGEHAVEDTFIPWILDQNNWTWWQGLPGISPKIGNYWDNYTGKDDDDDGIGDTPYVIPGTAGNMDNSPIWNDGIYGHVIAIKDTLNAPNNWDWAKDRFWCSGSGMIGDPYVIGPNDLWDGNIDAWGQEVGISIIENAHTFRIEGVTITNSSFAAIKTDNVKWFDAAIIDCNLSFNTGHGIYLEMTNDFNITNSIINNNTGYGIYLFNDTGGLTYFNNIKIMDNLISGNGEDGIHINLACDNNNITGNDIILNGGYGINVNETTIYGCNDTQINDNYIKGNKIANARDTAIDTRWYLGGRGNEWSDYESLGGIDLDDDGIGDIPYNISLTPLIQDLFPIFDDEYEETPLFINDTWNAPNNWAWASKKLFISGSGMAWDPYVIEDVGFNGTDSGSPIRIVNSNTKYFRIENCTLYDIGGPNSGSAGIYLSNVQYGEIINNTFSTNNDGNYGIHFDNGCQGINITSNLVESENLLNKFKYGIYLDTSGAAIPNQNVIDGNIIRNNFIGIYLSDGSPSNNVTNNEITDNTNIGILIRASNMNNIFNNDILDNGNGTIIENNAITNNIISNNIENNFDFGLYINSSGNFIYYNNFIDNGINARDDTKMGMNTWYKVLVPLGRGNYWSNYTDMGAGAEDVDDDGIGDIVYNLTGLANAQDLYPIYADGYNGSRLIIDGNLPMGYRSWNWAASRTWCSGSGTEWDPYIIKNLVIDGMQNGSCIYIFDTSIVHFIIDNATLYNSSERASPEPAGGIRLKNVQNAEIINCKIYDNGGHGIVIRSPTLQTRNITIRNNIINNNNGSGIYINGSMCFNIELDNNSISSNKEYGICVSEFAYDIMISNNYLDDNDIAGISIIKAGWMGNDIYNNRIIYGGIGILIDGYNPVDMFYNNISDVDTDGIVIQYSTSMMMMNIYNINITGNRIHDCSENGINFGGDNPIHSMNSKIIENYLYNNGDAGITVQDFDGSLIAKNILEGNGVGISLSYLNMFNEIRDNLILNNSDEGIAIFDISCENNRIYNNNFTGNGMNGFDFGIDNSWYFMSDGNYWDDYPGKDAEDNNLGDNSYDLIGGDLMNPKDLYPKWWDAPNFTILKPQQNAQLSAEENPEFVIKFDEGESFNLWYEIVGVGTSPTTVKFTPPRITGGPDFIQKIDSNLWKNTPQGQRTIRFYTNDSRGYVRYNDVLITKLNATAQVLPLPVGDDDDDDTTANEEDAEEEGLPWWLQAIFTGMISASAGLIIKISYSAHKRRKELYRKISDNLDRIDNIEKFLQDRLGFEDWDKLKESLEKYQKNEISSKELVKQSKKSVGKKFMHLFVKPKRKKKKK